MKNFLPKDYKKNEKLKINHSYLVEQFFDYSKIIHKIGDSILERPHQKLYIGFQFDYAISSSNCVLYLFSGNLFYIEESMVSGRNAQRKIISFKYELKIIV